MTTDTISQPSIQDRSNRTQAEQTEKQYSFSQIVWIWALATIPGALLFWLGLPVLDRMTEISVGYLVLIVTVIPYFWHFLLAFLILKWEGGNLDWNSIKDRLWLRTTANPRTGKRNNVLWFWAIPVIAVYGLTAAVPIYQSINDGWARILPVHEPAQYSFDVLFERRKHEHSTYGKQLTSKYSHGTGGTIFTHQNPGHLGRRRPAHGTQLLGDHAQPAFTR